MRTDFKVNATPSDSKFKFEIDATLSILKEIDSAPQIQPARHWRWPLCITMPSLLAVLKIVLALSCATRFVVCDHEDVSLEPSLAVTNTPIRSSLYIHQDLDHDDVVANLFPSQTPITANIVLPDPESPEPTRSPLIKFTYYGHPFDKADAPTFAPTDMPNAATPSAAPIQENEIAKPSLRPTAKKTAKPSYSPRPTRRPTKTPKITEESVKASVPSLRASHMDQLTSTSTSARAHSSGCRKKRKAQASVLSWYSTLFNQLFSTRRSVPNTV